MKENILPRRFSEKTMPAHRPVFHLKRKQGQSRISALLIITAVALATALTVLLMQSTVS